MQYDRGMETTSKPLRLTPRDIDVLRSLALYKRLSTQQIGRLHFPDAHEHTVSDRGLMQTIRRGMTLCLR
jgi:hypothetical protein